jgi:hypothetical protein
MTQDQILTELRRIREVLGALPSDPERRCIECAPIVSAALLLSELEQRIVTRRMEGAAP